MCVSTLGNCRENICIYSSMSGHVIAYKECPFSGK